MSHMSVSVKKPGELDSIRTGGRHLASIVATLCAEVRPGMTTGDIDVRARELIAAVGGQSAFLGYRPYGVKRKYPAAVCVSVNDEVVHGIPGKRVLQQGDLITIDCGLQYQGLFTDHAMSLVVGCSLSSQERSARQCHSGGGRGEVSSDVSQKFDLIHATQQALQVGIDAAQPGANSLDIGRAIQNFVAGRYGIVRELGGHGVGYGVHEDPHIPNFAMKGSGVTLVPGMVIAIEPMLNIGSADVDFLDDEYTVVTRSGNPSAHCEHTVIITPNGPEVVTIST